MSTADWKVGDKLLCVDAIPLDYNSGFPTGLRAGEEYEMLDKHVCTVSFVCVGVQVPPGFYHSYCPSCDHAAKGIVFHFAWRFIKLDPWLTEKDLDLQLQEYIEESRRVINPQIIIHQGNIK